MSDFIKIAPSLTLGFVVINAVFKLLTMMTYRNHIKALLVDLQRNVDRENHNRLHNFVAMNRLGNVLSRMCFMILCICAVALFIGPMVLIGVHYARGTLEDDMWVHPIAMMLVLNIQVRNSFSNLFFLDYPLINSKVQHMESFMSSLHVH